MAKDSFYFSHDYNARNDDRILELRSFYGAEGYGVFWMIVETMAENENGGIKTSLLGGLSIGFGTDKQLLLDIINKCLELELFYEENGFYYSKRLKTHKEYRKFLSDKGKEGADKKWGGYKGGHKGGFGDPYAKERKGKERIIGVSFDLENKTVLLSDNTVQKLGVNQICRLNFNDILPSEINKGEIN